MSLIQSLSSAGTIKIPTLTNYSGILDTTTTQGYVYPTYTVDMNTQGYSGITYYRKHLIDEEDYAILKLAKQRNGVYVPDRVFFNNKKKATTVMFGETATVVRAGDGDEFTRRVGFLEAYFQATCGMSKTKAKKFLESIVEVDKDERRNKNPKGDSKLPEQAENSELA